MKMMDTLNQSITSLKNDVKSLNSDVQSLKTDVRQLCTKVDIQHNDLEKEMDLLRTTVELESPKDSFQDVTRLLDKFRSFFRTWC